MKLSDEEMIIIAVVLGLLLWHKTAQRNTVVVGPPKVYEGLPAEPDPTYYYAAPNESPGIIYDPLWVAYWDWIRAYPDYVSNGAGGITKAAAPTIEEAFPFGGWEGDQLPA